MWNYLNQFLIPLSNSITSLFLATDNNNFSDYHLSFSWVIVENILMRNFIEFRIMHSFCKKDSGPVILFLATKRFNHLPHFYNRIYLSATHTILAPPADLLKHLGSGDQPPAAHVVCSSCLPVSVV